METNEQPEQPLSSFSSALCTCQLCRYPLAIQAKICSSLSVPELAALRLVSKCWDARYRMLGPPQRAPSPPVSSPPCCPGSSGRAAPPRAEARRSRSRAPPPRADSGPRTARRSPPRRAPPSDDPVWNAPIAPTDSPVWECDEEDPEPAFLRRSLYCTTPHGRIHIKEQGDPSAPPVFLMHGDGRRSSWLSWRAVMGPLSASGLRVLAADMPGYGASEGDRYAYRNRPVEVVRAIWDALGLRRAAIIGHSVGAKGALLCAAELRTRVRRLVLVSPVVPNATAMAAVRTPILLSWASDDSTGHPYSGPHGAKYLVKTTGCELLSWTEREYGGDTRRFYKTLFAQRAAEFLKQSK
eukprot:gnl/Trimastix_PCT/536.p2 GENE.gnl/Trimastix_PCT/536~~gnl/Trimastix_PCT/536.p2  ORF type:complete len:353 (+),score=60.57 gnl/Trimastix_PCT/536:1783-2841(+)